MYMKITVKKLKSFWQHLQTNVGIYIRRSISQFLKWMAVSNFFFKQFRDAMKLLACFRYIDAIAKDAKKFRLRTRNV